MSKRAPLAGTANEPEHRDLLNSLKDVGVGLLLILDDVSHSVPDEIVSAYRCAGLTVKLVNVLEERVLWQPG